jgi:hypothetical protein
MWSEEEKRYTLIKERADVVREMFERMDAGDGLARIARGGRRHVLESEP